MFAFGNCHGNLTTEYLGTHRCSRIHEFRSRQAAMSTELWRGNELLVPQTWSECVVRRWPLSSRPHASGNQRTPGQRAECQRIGAAAATLAGVTGSSIRSWRGLQRRDLPGRAPSPNRAGGGCFVPAELSRMTCFVDRRQVIHHQQRIHRADHAISDHVQKRRRVHDR